jgi:acetoin utilization protein AcuB
MKVRDIMSSRLVTVELDDRLALLKFLSPHIGSAPETARDAASLNERVHQIMSRKPITLPADSLIDDAIDLLLAHGISCVPIVDSHFKPVGIVTWRDLLRSLRA